MAYTTNQLISDAYHISNIVSREFGSVSGQQSEDGLRWLNDLLGKKVIESDLIPYEGTQTFEAVVGQEDYTIPNLITIDDLTYLKDSIRYPMTFVPRNKYRGQWRVETISSLPSTYFYERQLGGAKISLYWLPNAPYVFTITGIFRLNDISFGQDLDDILDKFYQTFLTYSLVEKMCNEYAIPVPNGAAKELSEYQSLISKQSRPLDMSLRLYSPLRRNVGLGTWAAANLFEGFVP